MVRRWLHHLDPRAPHRALCRSGGALPHPHIRLLHPEAADELISVGQLDEVGCELSIHGGLLRVRDKRIKLIAHVARSGNQLYKLRVKLAKMVCMPL